MRDENLGYRHYWNIVRYKSLLDLRGESSQAYLGILWWILDPLLYLVAFYVIFSVVMNRGGEGFVLFLLCGLVFWRWFDVSVKKSASAILANAGIINQVYLPKIILPVTEVVASTFRFLFILLIFLLLLSMLRGGVSLAWVALPLVMTVQILLILGVGVSLAALVAFMPDMRRVLDNALMFLFWMSGIFFDISQLSADKQQWLSLNPMAVLLQQYRSILLGGEWPEWSSLLVIASLSSVILCVGTFITQRWDMLFARIVR